MPASQPIQSGLFDSHCHLADPALDPELETIVERAGQAGVTGILAVGYDLPTSWRSTAIASTRASIRAAVGVHPNHVHAVDAATWAEIAALAVQDAVAAIGETGLDYYRLTAPKAMQIEALQWHLTLAESLRKPVIIHNREAGADLMAILSEWAAVQRRADWHGALGVMHCFGGDVALAERAIELGFVISLAGNVTYRTADEIRRVAAAVPDESLLLETDAPWLPPVPYRGRRCEPAYLAATARAIADLRRIDVEQLANVTARNTRRLLGLDLAGTTSEYSRTVSPA